MSGATRDSPSVLPSSIGRYQILRQMTGHALADVYWGFDPLIERPVGIKVFHLGNADAAGQALVRQTFGEETLRMGILCHHGIAALFDAGETASALFIASELVEGQSLAELLASGVPLDLSARAALLSQIADALDHAHQMGAVHLSLEPRDVLLDTHRQLKVGNFGVARIVDALSAASGTTRPAPGLYEAPERARGDAGDPRADVFSFAQMALDVLLATRTPDALVPPVPDDLAAAGISSDGWSSVFARGLAPDPGERFATCTSFLMELLLVLGVSVDEMRPMWELVGTNDGAGGDLTSLGYDPLLSVRGTATQAGEEWGSMTARKLGRRDQPVRVRADPGVGARRDPLRQPDPDVPSPHHVEAAVRQNPTDLTSSTFSGDDSDTDVAPQKNTYIKSPEPRVRLRD